MATRNVNLTEMLDRFVEGQVASGEFQNASEVVRAGLRLLKAEQDDRRARIERLRAAIQVGLDQIERGDVIQIDDLEAYFDQVDARVEAEVAARTR